jgi:hypothetical protein
MKKNTESRYLSLKRFTAYAPSALFLRNSILKIAKEHQFMTVRGLEYRTNRVLVLLVVSSCSISVIEAIYFFSTQDKLVIKIRFSSIIYILSLDFSFQSIFQFRSKFILRFLNKFILSLSILSYRFQVLIKSISIRSLIRVIKNTTNILTLPMTGPAFLIDKLLEPVEIK